MTSKERITVAIEGGTPDRVPVTLGLSEMVPVRYFGDDYIAFLWRDRVPQWKARVETEYDRFGADAFLHVAPGPSPHDPPQETCNVRESPDEVTYTHVIHTAKGDLSAEFMIRRRSPTSHLSQYVTDPEADADKVLELLKHPDTKDLDEIQRAYAEIGDRAHVGFWVAMPIDWWSSLRGPQQMIMDLLDQPALMKKLFQAYTEYVVAMTDYVLSSTTLDSVGLGGSNTSMSVISPDLHRTFSLAAGRALCDVAHKHNLAAQYHMCGRSRRALPITAEMGVDGFDALECPPTGDVDLAEVKREFGHAISLRGNVNSITVMLEGTPSDVRRDVARCMDSAKAGGGFILGVGDQTPYDTPEENLHAFVEAGRELGLYR